MTANRQVRVVHSLCHPFVVAVVLPSSLRGTPAYAFQWALVALVGVPTLILSSTPPDSIAVRPYRMIAGLVTISAAIATLAGLMFGGGLRPSAAGPLIVL